MRQSNRIAKGYTYIYIRLYTCVCDVYLYMYLCSMICLVYFDDTI